MTAASQGSIDNCLRQKKLVNSPTNNPKTVVLGLMTVKSCTHTHRPISLGCCESCSNYVELSLQREVAEEYIASLEKGLWFK